MLNIRFKMAASMVMVYFTLYLLCFQNKLKSVSKSIAEIEEERLKGDPNLDAINNYHEKIQQEGKLTPVAKVRLILIIVRKCILYCCD